MRLNPNLASLSVYMNYSKALNNESISSGRVSSGQKVNNAKDSPNGIAESERMRMQIRGLQMAARNSQDGMSMLQTADGGLNEMNEMLHKIKELVIQSGSASATPEDRKTIQNQIDQMVDGMDDISSDSEFNGVKLLSEDKDIEMTIGANSGEKVIISKRDVSSKNLKTEDGKSLAQLKSGELYNVKEGNNIDNALGIIDKSLNIIVSVRSQYGALQNRFQENVNNADSISMQMQTADSEIRDVDVAEEMVKYSTASILVQAGNAMMVQTNKLPQDALKILENVRSK
ncbi:flagellin [Clostridium drakei]|uniref:Flagellin n=1 Tax=Clostridium drakei TaxID=332101 RepID=A0A2U8DND8_9CLOT|nr:flagellin [Clostridium drakei]AWI03702.1 flagellin [Clostridium drakei]